MARGEDRLDVGEGIEKAASVGVTRIVQIGCDLPGARYAEQASREWGNVIGGAALHPNDAPLQPDLEAALAEIERLVTAHPKMRVVGETGLDFFRTGEEGRAAQIESFRRHIDLAKRHDKSLQIHDRDAHDAVVRVLDEEGGAPERWVMHCFSGDAAFARECLERGAYLSFSGTVTFKNAAYLREALAITPRERILVETDAPFLTPHPHRGATNAAYMVPTTMRVMAEVLGEDLEALCLTVNDNTDRAYGTW
jgi:TatD DNase family protein